MSGRYQSDDVLELLLKSAVDVSERMSTMESRLCVADVAIHILVNAHPDKDALKTHFMSAYIAMQGSETAQAHPQQAFAFEHLLERLFGAVD